MLDNRNALLFMRGERPIADEKYNLLQHPNVAFTPDSGGSAYRHDGLDALPGDIPFDPNRPEDYLLLDGDEFAQMLLHPDGEPDEPDSPHPNPISEKE